MFRVELCRFNDGERVCIDNADALFRAARFRDQSIRSILTTPVALCVQRLAGTRRHSRAQSPKADPPSFAEQQ